jgi:hypothetical protein
LYPEAVLIALKVSVVYRYWETHARLCVEISMRIGWKERESGKYNSLKPS